MIEIQAQSLAKGKIMRVRGKKKPCQENDLTGTKQKTNTMNKHFFMSKLVGFLGSSSWFQQTGFERGFQVDVSASEENFLPLTQFDGTKIDAVF